MLTWSFCYLFTLVNGRFRAMFAPRLLVSPNIVDHGDRTPGKAPTDGYTQRDIWRKGAGRGLAADATRRERPDVLLASWSLRMGDCNAWIASQVHARSIAGTRQVHRAP